MTEPRAPIPFIDLRPLAREVRARVLDDFARQIEACEFVEGATVRRLEQLLGAELGLPHVLACSNGSDALVLALRALGIGPGHKVALPDLSFIAPYEAIVQIGATPVLVDCDVHDLQMNFARFADAYERVGFDAAILVHLFGWASAELARFREFCRERGVPLLEDAAQAYGVRVGGAPLLAGAQAAILSFYPAKVIGAPMDAGAMLFRDAEPAALARALKTHGRSAHYAHEQVGYNARMSAMAAAWLLRVIARSEVILAARRAVLAGYRDRLARGSARVRVHIPPPGVDGNGYLCVVESRRDDAAELAEALAKRGIGTARTYPAPIHEQPAASEALVAGELVNAPRFCRRVLNLPLFYGIEEQAWTRAADTLLEVLEV